MLLSGPDSFSLSFDATGFEVRLPNGGRPFSGRASSRVPKLYVVVSRGLIVYVGVTKQPMRNRLRLGWTARGESGYYGYAWRYELTAASLHVWYHDDAATERACTDVETIEAEVVHLVRCSGQWPAHQTEIHFHPSSALHRHLAEQVFQFCAQGA